MIIFEKMSKNEFGGRLIDIGIDNVAVAAARVVERPPRCRKKVCQKRRCLQNVLRESLFAPDPDDAFISI